MSRKAKRPRPPSHLRIMQLLFQNGELSPADILHREPQLPRGTVYTTLQRLEKGKLVVSRQRRSDRTSGPPRRLYHLTRNGSDYCKMLAANSAGTR